MIGNLLTTLACQYCIQFFDSFPGLLETYVIDGLESMVNDERNLSHLLETISILMEKYPRENSPL